MIGFRDRKNVYTCRECGWQAITIDLDDGVTSYTIPCESPSCMPELVSIFKHSLARSALYQLPSEFEAMEPTHEWYRPDAAELERQSPAVKEHVAKGGLMLRKRGVVA